MHHINVCICKYQSLCFSDNFTVVIIHRNIADTPQGGSDRVECLVSSASHLLEYDEKLADGSVLRDLKFSLKNVTVVERFNYSGSHLIYIMYIIIFCM